MKFRELEVGDRVVLVSPHVNDSIPVGSRGTVIEIGLNGDGSLSYIGVAFDKYLGLHSCEGMCEKGHGYWFFYSEENLFEREESVEEVSLQFATPEEILAFLGK